MKKFFNGKKKSKDSLSVVSSVISVPSKNETFSVGAGDTALNQSVPVNPEDNRHAYGDVRDTGKKDPYSLFTVSKHSEPQNEISHPPKIMKEHKKALERSEDRSSNKCFNTEQQSRVRYSSENLNFILDPPKKITNENESSECELPQLDSSTPNSSTTPSVTNISAHKAVQKRFLGLNSPSELKTHKFPIAQKLRRSSYPSYMQKSGRNCANTSLKKRNCRNEKPDSEPLQIDSLEEKENTLLDQALRLSISRNDKRRLQASTNKRNVKQIQSSYAFGDYEESYDEFGEVIQNIKSLSQEVKSMQFLQNTEKSKSFLINRSSSSKGRPGPGCCPDYDPCCEEEEKECAGNQYQSGAITRYCDMLASGVQGSPQMIGDIIKDLHCVFEKTFGESQNLQCQQRSFKDQIRALKREICELQYCLDKLNKEISRLQMELRAAQSAFEQEASRRLGLETYASQIRARLSRAESEAEHNLKEKLQLECCLKEMQLKIKEMSDMIDCLTMERDQLLKNCKGHEDWKNRYNNNISDKDNRCGQLEEALAKCCKANEELQHEVANLKRERDCLIMAAEKLQAELKRLSEEFEKAKKCWEAERKCLEKTIAELRQTIDCLTVQNKQICQKMKDVVTAHHFEMDCLKKEAAKFKKLYEAEREAKEKLQKLLDDCEEKKLQLTKQKLQQQQEVKSSKDPCGESNKACDDIMNKYSFPPPGSAFNCNPDCGGSNSSKGAQFREKQNAKEIVQLKQQLQVCNVEITTERENLVKMRHKVDHYKDALRLAREREQNHQNANDSKIKELKVKLGQVKFEHETFVRAASIERDDLVSAIKRLEREKEKIEHAYKSLEKEMKASQENNNAIDEIILRKDKLEKELERLKKSIQEKYVDRAAVTQWKENYEARINALNEEYERSIQTRIHAAVVKVRADMEKELYDRNFAEKLREKTENSLRTEYSSMVSSWKSDMEKFKQLVRTRDEEISSLKSSIEHLKHKYSSEANMKEELFKKLQIVAHASRTSLRSLTAGSNMSNNNIQDNNNN